MAEKDEWEQQEELEDKAIVAAMSGDERFTFTIEGSGRKGLTVPGLYEAALSCADKYGHIKVDVEIDDDGKTIRVKARAENLKTGAVRWGYKRGSVSEKHADAKILSKAIRNAMQPLIPWSIKVEVIRKFDAEDSRLELMDRCMELVEENEDLIEDNFDSISNFWTGIKEFFKVGSAEEMPADDWETLLKVLETNEKTLIRTISETFEMPIEEREESEEDTEEEDTDEEEEESVDQMERCIKIAEADKTTIKNAFGGMENFWEAVKFKYDVAEADAMEDEQWLDIIDIFIKADDEDDLLVTLKEKFADYFKADKLDKEEDEDDEPNPLMDKCVELVEKQTEVIEEIFESQQGFWDAVQFVFDVKEAKDINENDWNVLIDILENSEGEELKEALKTVFLSYLEQEDNG